MRATDSSSNDLSAIDIKAMVGKAEEEGREAVLVGQACDPGSIGADMAQSQSRVWMGLGVDFKLAWVTQNLSQ